MSNQAEEVVQAIENLNTQRREEVSKTAVAALPKYIRSIESTEAHFVIEPDIMPLMQVDWSTFFVALKEEYRLEVERPKALPNLAQLGLDAASLDDAAIAKVSLEYGKQISFRNGRFPTGSKSFISIQGLSINSENLLAKVAGRTDVAEVLCKEIFELLWHAAGAPKIWDSTDVQQKIALKSYATHTKVDTGVDLRTMLDPEIMMFMKTNLDDGLRLGASTMPRSALDNFDKPAEVTSSLTFDDLTLRVLAFEPTTGRTHESRIRFAVSARSEQGKGVVDVMSELPFDEHAKLVEELIDRLKGSSS